MDINRRIQKAKEDLDHTMRMISEMEDVDKEQYTSDCAEILEKLIQSNEQVKVHSESIKNAAKVTTVKDFDEIISRPQSVTNIDAKNTAEFKEFMTNVDVYFAATEKNPAVANRVVDQDVEMEEETITIDPLTKQRLKNPVRNKICGHVYEKSAAHEAIKLNSRVRCPTVGCGNKEYIQMAHLAEDRALMMRLRNINKQNCMESSDEE